MERQVKILKDTKPPRRAVSESEALEFINNVQEWRKKKLAERKRKLAETERLEKGNYSGIATKRHKTHNESRKGANQSQFCWLHQAHFHPFPFCVSCASSWLRSYGERAL
jgi:predicted adenine nucleotide alpha hydrolase (AANH) superfamily ATPase